MTKIRTTTLLMGALFLAATACGDTSQPPNTRTEATPAPNAGGTAVTVAKTGSRFSPSVASASIPDGNWICDMRGNVHYASGERGDGKCPVCSMDLVHKGHAGAVDHKGHEGMGADGHMKKGHEGHEGHDH